MFKKKRFYILTESRESTLNYNTEQDLNSIYMLESNTNEPFFNKDALMCTITFFFLVFLLWSMDYIFKGEC